MYQLILVHQKVWNMFTKIKTIKFFIVAFVIFLINDIWNYIGDQSTFNLWQCVITFVFLATNVLIYVVEIKKGKKA